MTDGGMVIIETERLVLRPLTMDDFDAVHAWASNPVNTRYMGWGPNGEEHTRSFLSAVIENAKNAPRRNYDFAVVLKEIDAVIGSCGIYTDGANDTAELGWILHMDHWKKGCGTELGGELIRFGFEDLKLRRIYAHCAAVNYGSRRIMERNGMRREATHVKKFWARIDKEWIDEAVYAILAEDYFGKNKAAVSIIPYEPKYRGDMLFCYLAAKDAIGSYSPGEWNGPALRDDLLDIEKNYFERGDVFYLAIDGRGRVAGMLGTQTVSPDDLWLKRLFIKPELKGRGIGSKLLAAVEEFAVGKGVAVIHTRFSDWYREAAVFYPAKGFAEAEPDGNLRHMVKRLK